MAEQQDILLQMSLDISGVEENLTRVKGLFDGLSTGLGGLDALSGTIEKLASGAREFSVAFKEAGKVIEEVTGTKTSALSADARLAKAELSAARAARDRAAAEGILSKSINDRVAAQTRAASGTTNMRRGANNDLYDRAFNDRRAVQFQLDRQEAVRRRQRRPTMDETIGGAASGMEGWETKADYSVVEAKLREMDAVRANIHGAEMARIREESDATLAALDQRAARTKFLADKEVANVQNTHYRNQGGYDDIFGDIQFEDNRRGARQREQRDTFAANKERFNPPPRNEATLADTFAPVFAQEDAEGEKNVASRKAFQQRRLDIEREQLSSEQMYAGMFDKLQGQEESAAASQESEMRNYYAQMRNQINYAGGPSRFAKASGMSGEDMSGALAGMEEYSMKLQSFPSYWNRISADTVRHGIQLGANLIIFESIFKVVEEIGHAIHEASEFQVQGVLFTQNQAATRMAGGTTDQSNTNDLMREASSLAATYGDNVNDVAQDLQLWYKRTGDLTSASYMSAQALEFQVATGTDLEDTYRTLTALGSQLTGQKIGGGIAGTYDLSRSSELLHLITAAAVEAGAGLHQFSAAGEEVKGTNNNSANILIESMEKDAAALKSLGFTTTQTISLNAALIQSFGNTGQGASEAAEKIGRLAGGLASLSEPGKNKALAKDHIDLSKLTTAQESGDPAKAKDAIEQLSDVYEKLTPQEQKHLDVVLAGSRQYEALIAIMENLGKARKIEADIVNNENLEDKIADNMQATLEQSVKRLQGAFGGLEVELGTDVIPGLTTLVNVISTQVIPLLDTMIQHINMTGGAFAAATIEAAAFAIAGPAAAVVAAPFALGAAAIGAQNDDIAQGVAKYGPGYKKYNSAERDARATINDPDFAQYEKEYKHFHDTVVAPHDRVYSDIDRRAATGPEDKYGRTQYEYDTEAARKHIKNAAFKPTYLNDADRVYGSSDSEATKAYLGQIDRNQEAQDQSLAAHVRQNGLTDKIADALKKAEGPHPADKQGPLTVPGGGTGPSKEKGLIKDYAVFGDYLSQKRDDLQDELGDMSGDRDVADRGYHSIEKSAGVYGWDQSSLDKYQDRLAAKQQMDLSQQHTLTGEQDSWEKDAAHAKQMQGKFAPNTAENRGWLEQFRTAKNEVRSIGTEITKLQDDTDTLGDKFQSAASEFAKQSLTDIRKAGEDKLRDDRDKVDHDTNKHTKFSDISNWGNDEARLHDQILQALNRDAATGALRGRELSDALAEEASRHREVEQAATDAGMALRKEQEATRTSYQEKTVTAKDKGFDTLAKVANFKPEDLTMYQELISIQREGASAAKEYKEAMKTWGGSADAAPAIEQWYSVTQATLEAEKAAAQYQDRLEKIKDSSWYKGLESAFKTIGDDIASSITDSLDGVTQTDKAIQNIKDETDALKSQEEFKDAMFSADHYHSAMDEANHILYMRRIQLETEALKKQEEQKEYAAAHPPLIKKIAGDLAKSFVDSSLQDFEKQMMGGLAGDKSSEQKQMQDALQQYVAATTGAQKDNFNTFSDATSTMAKAVADFQTAISQSYLDPNYNGPTTDTNPLNNVVGTGADGSAPGNTVGSAAAKGGVGGGGFSSGIDAIAALTGAAAIGTGFGFGTGSSDSNVTKTLFGGSNIASTYGINALGNGVGASIDGVDTAASAEGDWGSSGGVLGSLANTVFSSFGGEQNLAKGLSLTTAAGSKSIAGQGLDEAGNLLQNPKNSIGTQNTGAFIDTAGNIISDFSTSTDSGLGAVAGAGIGFGLGGPLGAELGSSLGGMVGGLLGPHYSQTTNPDMYANDGFDQGMANANGSFGTSAGGPAAEDYSLSQELNGQNETQYLSSFVTAHPGGQGLTGESLLLWQQANTMTGEGQATKVGGLHQGNISFENAEGQSVGASGNWSSLLTQIQNTTQSVYEFEQAIGGANQALVVLNSYGSGQASMPYAWNTPGYEYSPTGYESGTGTTGLNTPVSNVASNPVNPSAAGSTASIGNTTVATAPVSTTAAQSSGQITTTVNLDGRTIARTVQAYTQRANSNGYSYVT